MKDFIGYAILTLILAALFLGISGQRLDSPAQGVAFLCVCAFIAWLILSPEKGNPY